MNKYMVFLHEKPPEIIEADRFEVNPSGSVIQFWIGDRLSAAFYSWIGLKEITPKQTAAMPFGATGLPPATTTWSTLGTTNSYLNEPKRGA